MVQFREPLVIPCVAFAAGILAAHYAHFDWSELALGFALFVLAVLVARAQIAACRMDRLGLLCMRHGRRCG